MRNLKKFLALVMAMVMAFSLMLTVNAKDIVTEFSDRDQADAAFTEAVDVLSGMKVFQGDPEGTFRPASTITRAEVAALIYRLATGDVDDVRAGLYANYGNFADVAESDWFAGYVGYCANAGYIKGHGGYFNPYGQVTGYEVLAMVLRAAGYDQNHEFEGITWQTNVSALSTQLHILDDVKTTHYGNTLHLASRRDVVASLLFNAADKVNMVTYTQLTGYNKYTTPLGNETTDGKANLNPTLGYKYFGLTDATRIILGNQATGEGCTLLGNDTVKYTDTNKQKHTLDVSYVYPGSVIAAADAGDVAADAKVSVGDGIKLDVKTGLDMFGHKVKAWYDDRDTGNKTTYAVLDKSTLTGTVQAMVAAKNDADVLLSDSTTPANAKLGMAAQKAGFSVDLETSKAWVSDRYGRIMGCKGADGTVDVPAAGKADMKSTKAVDTNDGIYALISNNDKKTVDVIVSLEGEVGIIAQKDTTATVQTLTVGGTDKAITNKSSFEGTAAGIFAINSLTEGSTQALGDKVTVWQVQGTNNADVYSAYADATGNVGTHTNGNSGTDKYFRYELEKLETTVSGTVRTYGSNHEITMTDGTTYQQSWFRWLPTGGRATDAVIGTNDSTEPFTVPDPFQAGVTYTIALDKFGNWLGAVPARDQFIYGTFGDYGFGDLGSGTIGYTLTGVNWDGEKVVNHKITSMHLNSKDYFDGNATANQQLADGYSNNTEYPITKKILGTITGGSEIGNRIFSGNDTGFVVSEDGALTDDVAGYANPMAATTWAITKADVANGFADLADDGTTLATPKTQFIVVTGTGTDTLDVKIYNGMSEFLGNSSWVTINGAAGKKSSTYFLTEADLYNRYNTDDNKQVAKVIVDARDVTWSTVENLYYLAPGKTAITGLKLAGNPDDTKIKPYEMWNNGVKGIYWIDEDSTRTAAGIGSPSAGASSTLTGTALGTAGDGSGGDFYRLIQISTAHGTPIYKAVKALDQASHTGKIDVATVDTRAKGGICNVDQTYSYTAASELNTGYIGSETFRVNNATVADLVWTPDLARSEIKSVADINAAISGGYTVTVSIVNDGVNVSTIYVIDVT